METHGVDYATRRTRVREHMLTMQALWRDEVASFEGRFVSLAPSWSWPKPDTPVPVLLGGGAGPEAVQPDRRVRRRLDPDRWSRARRVDPSAADAAAEAGRDPDTLRIVPFGSHPTPEKLEHFASIGVTECVFRLPSAPADDVLPILDEQARLITR